MYAWTILGNNEYYQRAAKLTEDAFDYLTLQSHRIIHVHNQVDLSVSDGCTGILLGIDLLTKKNWIGCPWQEVAISLDPMIFGSMMDKLFLGKEKESEALSIARYAFVRDTRFAREYLKRFIEEWKTGSSVAFFDAYYSKSTKVAIDALHRKADVFSVSNLPPSQWYTIYNGLYRLHLGLADGLAGIGLSLFRGHELYDEDWRFCLPPRCDIIIKP